jgi:hypothetical protein
MSFAGVRSVYRHRAVLRLTIGFSWARPVLLGDCDARHDVRGQSVAVGGQG